MRSLLHAFLLFTLSFGLFYAFAASPIEIEKWGVTLVKADLAGEEPLVARPIPGGVAKAAVAALPKAAADVAAVVPKAPLDTASQTILLIGDSMAEGLMLRLLDYADQNKHKLATVTWYGSGTRQYGKGEVLREAIRKHKPTFIILCLGTNELLLPKIGKQYQQYVDNIVSQLGDIPFVWVGPPSWKGNYAISGLIESKVGANRFFRSEKLTMPRRADGVHPTMPGFAYWGDELGRWIQTVSAHPIRMTKPLKSKFHPKPNVTVLKQK
jgi:hypothetical protein